MKLCYSTWDFIQCSFYFSSSMLILFELNVIKFNHLLYSSLHANSNSLPDFPLISFTNLPKHIIIIVPRKLSQRCRALSRSQLKLNYHKWISFLHWSALLLTWRRDTSYTRHRQSLAATEKSRHVLRVLFTLLATPTRWEMEWKN